MMHGGDIYRNNIHYDFSVNLNPLGFPSEVQWVLTEAAIHANKYPDIYHEQLVKDTAELFDVRQEEIVYGNGASELIMAICHAFSPKKAMLITPCFLGYERCLKGASHNCEIINYGLLEEDDFNLTDAFLESLSSVKPQLLFLTNPNNPNGLTVKKELLEKIVKVCESQGTILVIDECFLPLTGREKELSLASRIRGCKGVIVIRAFTKSFAIPGVRLGYAICSRKTIADDIKMHLPEWNLSIFAQMAGVQCLKQLDFINEAAELINRERSFLSMELTNLGFKVYPSDANYILFKADNLDLKEKLLEYSILIRECDDFTGLDKGYYRVAVRNHNENSGLLTALENVINE